LFLKKKQKQKYQILEAALHHNKMAVAWPKTKTKFKLRRTKQNKTEKQNSLNYY